MAKNSGVAIKLKSYAVPRQRGELARFRVIKGPDQGAAFIVVNTRATIGRGDENDVVIGDLKASRLHAELSASPTGWMIRDLGSANGILHNGVQARQASMKTRDLVTVGETVLEFMGAEATDQLLAGERVEELVPSGSGKNGSPSVSPPRSLSDPFGLKRASAAAAATPQAGSKKVVKLAIVGGIAAIAMIGWELMVPPPSNKKKPARQVSGSSAEPQDLASLMPKLDKPPTSKYAEMFYMQGFREYRERNYIRALSQFELVLQLAPDHEMARRYRDNSRLAIEEEVRTHLELGKKDFTAGKLRKARAHYEAILRLLNTDQTNPSYIEAKDQLERVKSEMGGE